MRRAFTLVELMVAVTIGVAVIGGAAAVWSFSERSRGVTATARALQTALLVQEELCADLARLVQVGGTPVSCPKDKGRISFYVLDDQAATGLKLPVHGVTYAHQKDRPLTRTSQGAVRPLGTAPLTAASFEAFEGEPGAFVRVTLTVGREAGEPPGPPTVHSFLARLPPTPPAGLDVDIMSPVAKDEDEPPAGDLPEL